MLLDVKKSTPPRGRQIKLADYSQEELYYNAQLMQEAGLIEAKVAPTSTDFHVLRLTYAGQEFLDATRNDTLWAKAKEIVIKNTGTLTVEGVKIALSTLIKHPMGG